MGKTISAKTVEPTRFGAKNESLERWGLDARGWTLQIAHDNIG